MTQTDTINWQDLQFFLAVFEAGSLTKASVVTGVSQPTLGRRMKALETRLGNRLFNRLPGSFEPTSLGRQMAALAVETRNKVNGIFRSTELQKLGTIVIRLSASMTISTIVADHLAELTGNAQRVVLDIASTRVTTRIGQRECDMAIRLRKPPTNGPIVSRRFGRIAFAVYGARRLIGGVRYTELPIGIPFLGLTDDRPPPQPDWFDRFMAERQGRLLYRLGEVFLRLRSVKTGLGISLLPCVLADCEPDLVRVTKPIPELTEDLYLLVHRDLAKLTEIQSVSANIQRLFKRRAADLEGRLGE